MNRHCSASLLMAAFVALTAATALAAEPGKDDIHGWKSNIKLESEIAHYLPELDGKYKLRVTEATFDPGAYVDGHYDVPPGIRLVTSGEFTLVRDHKSTIYKAGDTFFISGKGTHTVYNKGSVPAVLLIFEVLPTGKRTRD